MKLIIALALVIVGPWAVYSLTTGRKSDRAAMESDEPATHVEPIAAPANVGEYADKIHECEQPGASSLCFNRLAEATQEPYFCERTVLDRRQCFSGVAANTGDWRLCEHITESIRKRDGTSVQRPYIAEECYLAVASKTRDPTVCDALEARWNEHPPTDGTGREEQALRANSLALCRAWSR